MNNYPIILLISVDFDWLSKTLNILEKYQHVLFCARNGMEGWGILQRLQPDLIICEDTLRDMQGTDLRNLIGNDKKLCEIPFVLGNENQQDIDAVIKSVQAGKNDLQAVKNNWLPVSDYFEYNKEFSNRFFISEPIIN